tara:strand:- start:133 stop:1113 length:981 start_codon:yes stop_codon:yes gene_type:complete
MDNIDRYEKQIILPMIGNENQLKFKNSKIIIIGLGGIGCPVLSYLSSMGFMNISILDYDKVELSNLHRQIIYTENDISKFKTECAKQFCIDRNSLINIKEYNVKITNNNSLKILENYDIIVDCTDNIYTRYVINDACVILNKKYFFGSAIGTSGQIGVLNYNNNSPCLRCIYNNNTNDSCNSNGVLGVIPNLIGNLMAIEIVKIVCNIENELTNKLLNYDIVHGFYKMNIVKNINCLVCSKNKSININNYTKLNIYDKTCNISYEYSTTNKNNVININENEIIDDLYEKYKIDTNDLIFECINKIKSRILVSKLRQSGKNNVWFLI